MSEAINFLPKRTIFQKKHLTMLHIVIYVQYSLMVFRTWTAYFSHILVNCHTRLQLSYIVANLSYVTYISYSHINPMLSYLILSRTSHIVIYLTYCHIHTILSYTSHIFIRLMLSYTLHMDIRLILSYTSHIVIYVIQDGINAYGV